MTAKEKEKKREKEQNERKRTRHRYNIKRPNEILHAPNTAKRNAWVSHKNKKYINMPSWTVKLWKMLGTWKALTEIEPMTIAKDNLTTGTKIIIQNKCTNRICCISNNWDQN